MELKYYTLGSGESGSFFKTVRIIFGVICIAVAIFWAFLSNTQAYTDGTIWITVTFLLLFGFYQIWSGLGKALRFIQFSENSIRLKKDAILPAVEIAASDIAKVDIYPMNLVIFLKSQKKILLRFGSMYQETNETVKDEILIFAGNHESHSRMA